MPTTKFPHNSKIYSFCLQRLPAFPCPAHSVIAATVHSFSVHEGGRLLHTITVSWQQQGAEYPSPVKLYVAVVYHGDCKCAETITSEDPQKEYPPRRRYWVIFIPPILFRVSAHGIQRQRPLKPFENLGKIGGIVMAAGNICYRQRCIGQHIAHEISMIFSSKKNKAIYLSSSLMVLLDAGMNEHYPRHIFNVVHFIHTTSQLYLRVVIQHCQETLA